MSNEYELAPEQPEKQIVARLLELISSIPTSSERESDSPADRSRELASSAAWRAAAVSGGLAIPPGPMGLLTIIPDLVAIWQIQRKMVADIAATFGKTAGLGQEQMLVCLFKHSAGQAVRDLVVRTGQRVLVRRASLQTIQRILNKLGIVVTQRVAGRTISRWIPIVGAVGMGAYAYYDTASVAKTTIELFQNGAAKPSPSKRKKKPAAPKKTKNKKSPQKSKN